jgi:uncharacterized protein YaiI (UPF0178 family)
MLDLFVDIDNCRAYPQVLGAAQRHGLELYVVTRDYLHADANVHLIVAHEEDGVGARDWIAANIRRGDICVTDDRALASGCLLRGAVVVEPAVDSRSFAQRLDLAIASARSAARRPALVAARFNRPGFAAAGR